MQQGTRVLSEWLELQEFVLFFFFRPRETNPEQQEVNIVRWVYKPFAPCSYKGTVMFSVMLFSVDVFTYWYVKSTSMEGY